MDWGKLFSWFFIYFLPLLNLKIKRATHLSYSSRSCPPAERNPFSEVALQPREFLKKTYFPLPLSILAGTNLITLILFFLQPPFDSQENPSPIRFPGKFILVWFLRKSIQNPQRKPKNLLFFCSLCFLDLF